MSFGIRVSGVSQERYAGSVQALFIIVCCMGRFQVLEIYTREDVVAGLQAAGVERGDVVFFQSRLYGLGKPVGVSGKEALCDFFLAAMLSVLGPEGTLVVPTFTTQVARYDQPYVVEETRPNYGLFPEYAAGHEAFVRSGHPLLSVAATGARAREICEAPGASAYGARSAFDVMVRMNARNVFLGLEVRDAVTVAHYMEMHYGVPYIYNKILKWRPVRGGVVSGQCALSPVRYLEYDVKYDLDRMQADVMNSGRVRTARVGGGCIHGISMNDLLEVGYDGLERDPFYLLAAAPDFDYGRLPYDGPTVHRETNPVDGAGGIPALCACVAPEFHWFLEMLLPRTSAGHRKALVSVLGTRGEHDFREAEQLVQAAFGVMDALGIARAKAVDYYNAFCTDTFKEQMEFRRSGAYRVKEYEDALRDVYSNSEVMEYYMIGLLMSQALWDNHWRLLKFARSWFFAPFCQTSRLHVEVGPGHGWFLNLGLSFGAEKVVGFDISEQSANLSSTLLRVRGFDPGRWDIRVRDAQAHIPLEDGCADTFMAGEVLEHIPDPAGFLREAARVMRPGGAAWITTAANAPAVDHLYLFHSADEIRDMIRGAGFTLERDIEIQAGLIGDIPLINYGEIGRASCRERV